MAMTGQDPKDTYLDILWVDNTNLGIPPATTVTVKSGGGNASLLALSQAEIEFLGILSATVASGIVLELGISFVADAVTVDSVLDKGDPTVGIFFTTGDPEGVFTAGIGSLALREDGGAGTSVYIKESGVGNTGWKAFNVIASFTDLDDVPGVYVPSKYLRVNGGGTALEFVDAPAVSFIALSDTDPVDYVGAAGKYVAVNGTVDGLTFADPPVGTFIALTDTDPADYTNADGNLVRVNSTPDGLEFLDGTQGDVLYHNGTAWVALTAGTNGYYLKTQGVGANPTWDSPSGTVSFIDLSDTDPTDYTGDGGSLVRVNSTPDGLEFLGGAQGEVLYHNGTAWVALAVGSANSILTTHSTGQNPTWEALPAAELPSGAQGEILYHNGSAWVVLGVGAASAVLTTHSTGQNPTWEALPAAELPSGAQGEILYHNGSGWVVLAVGTNNAVLTTHSTAQNPTWETPASGLPSGAQGDILYHNGSAWVVLSAGSPGLQLTTQGAGANPGWESSGIQQYTTDEVATRESWLGSEIFVKLIDFGAGPNATSKSVDSGLLPNDLYMVIGMEVAANNPGSGWVGSSFADNTASFTYNKVDQKVYCVADTAVDLSGNDYYVMLKYIKAPATMAGATPHVMVTIAGATWGGLAQGVHILSPATYNFAYTGASYSAPGVLSFSWKWTATNDKFWFIVDQDATHRESYGLFQVGTGTGNTDKISASYTGTNWVSPYTKGIGPGNTLFAAYTVGSVTLTVSRTYDFPLKPPLA